jgi:flavin-dependent dehydrogenase
VRDVVVIGGGPAGLAAAAACARRGLDALVLEQRAIPVDKACGEGVMPRGLAALERLGALSLVAAADRAPLRAIRWVDEDGAVAEARLPGAGGVGIRRLALSAALAAAARRAGAEVRERCAARGHRTLGDAVAVLTERGEERARFVVAADGLGSPVRRREGLDAPSPAGRRFGLRRHYAVAPWAAAVEVHFADGVEAYVTPAGARRVGIAFLCEEAARGRVEELLARFPRLARRVDGAAHDSAPAGMGPLARGARARVAGRVVLVGDAAGYVDALTGEGLSLALDGAVALAGALPAALRDGPAALAGWDRDEARRFARAAAFARLALAVARRPAARRQAIREGARHPAAFARLVRWAVG